MAMTTLLLDNVKYKLWTPQKENQLEEMVREHAKDIFGENSIYFEKRKISSEFGITSIPDGFVVNFLSKKLYTIEIELSTHGYDHIVSQGNRHIDAIKDLSTKNKIVKWFYNEIKNDPYKKLAKKLVKEDLYKFLVSISEKPELLIITDGISNDIKQAEEAFIARIKTNIIEFKTFEKEGFGLGVHAHLFEPIVKRERERVTVAKPELEGKITPQSEYRIPILEALIKMGGKGRVKDVLEKVEVKMKDRLTKVDYEKIHSGEVRWKNHARWERKNMIKEGLLKKDSPYGVWEITDKGQKYFTNQLKVKVKN